MNNTTTEAAQSVSQQPWRVRDDGRVVLLAQRVGARKTLHFPPLPEHSPLAGDRALVELTGTPVLYSFTIVHSSPKANKAPQPLGQLDFPEGVRVFGRLQMPEGRRPVVGEPMRVLIEEGRDGPVYAFSPLNEQAS